MPEVATHPAMSSGHGDFLPHLSAEGEAKFTIGTRPVLLEGHAFQQHTAPGQSPHASEVTGGEANFTIGGKKLARIGDSLGPTPCGGTIDSPATNFTVG